MSMPSVVISYLKLDFNIFFIEKLSNLRYNEIAYWFLTHLTKELRL